MRTERMKKLNKVGLGLMVVFGYFLHVGECINIDSRLTIVKSDCYERIAIGQKINEKNVSRKAHSKTFMECQMECTNDGEKCKSFSYGVGVKGNSTCEISSTEIKQTPTKNLEGTTIETDYDLYVRKVDCKFVFQPEVDAIQTEPDHTTVKLHSGENTENSYLPSSSKLKTSPNVPLPFNADYKPKRRPESYKKQHDYGELEHRLGILENRKSNRKQDDVGNYDDEANFDGYIGAVSYNQYDKPEVLDNKKKEEAKNRVPYDYIGSNGPPRGYGYSNAPENKPKPLKPFGLDNLYDYTPNSYDYNKNKLPYRPNQLNKPYNNFNRPKPIQNDGYDNSPINDFPNLNSGSNFESNFHDPDNPNYPTGSQNHFQNLDSGYEFSKPQQMVNDQNNYHNSDKKRPYFSSVRPVMEHAMDYESNPKRPNFGFLGGLYELNNGEYKPYGSGGNSLGYVYSPKYPHQKPSLDEEYRPLGELIASYVTEIRDVCFKRALAGKRISRAFVRKIVSCERVEDCHQECTEEKKFICEGFNYRLDSSGRGRGDCELIDLPFVLLDPHKDIITNPNYDYYEKDRNSYQRCKDRDIQPFKPPQSYPQLPPSGGIQFDQGSYGHGTYGHGTYGQGSYGQQSYGQGSYGHGSYGGGNKGTHRYDSYPREPPRPGFVFRLPSGGEGGDFPPYNRRSGEYRYCPPFLKKKYNCIFHLPQCLELSLGSLIYPNIYNKTHILAHIDWTSKSSLKIVVLSHLITHKEINLIIKKILINILDPYPNGDKHHTYTHPHIDNDYKSYLPPPNTLDINKYHNKYDGRGESGYDYNSYGRGKPHPAVVHYGIDDKQHPVPTNYLPIPFDGNKKHWSEYGGGNYRSGGYGSGTFGSGGFSNGRFGNNGVSGSGYLPPKSPTSDYLPPVLPTVKHYEYPSHTNECSLRSATGYRLYKKIVKKILTVSSIYDCEEACFHETDFICTSYAFRYIVGSGIPPNNCYLSDRNYKELDYYTDLEQDRNFDIYTMHNKDRCSGSVPLNKISNECFLHVRSGQRLDDTCVRDSLFVKSFLDCQLECLKSERFLCRSFSYRSGSAVIGGISENCQLSDVPFRELNPHRDLISDPGFVLYERASYGYGCELDHVNDQSLFTQPSVVSESDKLCYIGYGWSAKLLPSAVRKALRVPTEEECRAECTKFRMETSFCCMSFSYSSALQNGLNCLLSDIVQRDLLETVDFEKDRDFWLFSWDTSNPQCQFSEYYEQSGKDRNEISLGGITWRIYSVGGWPCKRGTLCKESALGFWFCELEGGSPSSWDYCCRPGHQCGYSEGYAYQWCYVGPSFTQWRKCNDKYYPYLPPLHVRTPLPSKPPTTYLPPKDFPSTPILLDHDTKPPTISTTIYHIPPTTSIIDPHVPTPTLFLEEPKKSYLPPSHRESRPWQTSGKPLLSDLRPPYRVGFRPDRPNATPLEPEPKPSLNEYENHFNDLFLDPPKPGGFGQARHWPVSYLHKEGPPNATISIDNNFSLGRMKEARESKLEPKFEAIKNLIDVIKTNDLENVKYQITNDSNKVDDVLHVQIPLPSNFTDILENGKGGELIGDNNEKLLSPKNSTSNDRKITENLPVYRRSYIMKTSKTDARKWKFPDNQFGSIR
nr:uncharacterized protein LOC111425362 [Onthophagus taurus]